MSEDSKQLGILQHSLGLDQYGRGTRWYRNHFCTGPGSDDYPACMALVAQGLMTRRPGNALSGGDDIFIVTAEGIAHVDKHTPKRSRRKAA